MITGIITGTGTPTERGRAGQAICRSSNPAYLPAHAVLNAGRRRPRLSRTRHLSLILCGAIAAAAICAPAAAQDDPAALFQGRYVELRGAIQAGDTARIATVLAPEYRMTDIQGEQHDAAGTAERMARMAEGQGRSVETRVLSAAITGDSAAVEQELAGAMTRAGEDGAQHKLEIQIRSSDSWAWRGGAWLLVGSVQKELTVRRDGEVLLHQAK